MALWDRRKSPTAGVATAPGSEVRFGRTLDSLVGRLKRLSRPCLLDLGPTCGPNIEFFIRIGCRVQVDDYLSGVLSRRSQVRPEPPRRGLSPQPRKAPVSVPPVEHETGRFDAVLCWDLFDYLPAEEAEQVGREVRRVTAEGGYILAFFGPRADGQAMSPRRFRIGQGGHLAVDRVDGPTTSPHHLPNRDVLRIFRDFEIAQTVLLKNGVREMLLQKRRTTTASAQA